MLPALHLNSGYQFWDELQYIPLFLKNKLEVGPIIQCNTVPAAVALADVLRPDPIPILDFRPCGFLPSMPFFSEQCPNPKLECDHYK
jgi:hypothetical protein